MALAPNTTRPSKPGVTTVRRLNAATGDTLIYKATWGKAARATGYAYSVRSSKAGWTLPTGVNLADTFATFKLINATWDSTTFRLVVWGKNGTVRSIDSSYVSWSVIRRPGTPGPVLVDSSLVVTMIDIKPDSVKVEALHTVQFCAYLKFLDSKYRMISNQVDIAECKAFYDKFPIENRLSGYPIARILRNAPYQAITVNVAFNEDSTYAFPYGQMSKIAYPYQLSSR